MNTEETPQTRLTLDRLRPSQDLAIAIGIGLMAFGMYLWQLSVPEFLQFYDSGVYLAASIHLVSGVVPYRDFTFVQPPGICLLMVPVGIVSRIFGSHDGFILVRIVSAATTALNASLVAMLVRHRGRVAMLVAGAGLALLPVAFFVSSALELDPYCICFILIGSLFVFSRLEGHRQLTNRDLVIGGVLFGLAAIIKLWAVFPFIALVLCLMPQHRRRVLQLIGAAGATFVAVSLPFFLSAPVNFLSEVFVEQLNRKAVPADSASIVQRLITMSGLRFSSVSPTATEAVVAFLVLTCFIVVAYWRRLGHESVDTYLLLATLVSVGGILAAPVSYDYYGYFTAPFLLGLLGLCVGRVGTFVKGLFGNISVSSATRRLMSWTAALSTGVLLFALVLYVTTFYTNVAWAVGDWAPRSDTITKIVPPGSCVVYEEVSWGVIANRLVSTRPNCPSEVDIVGMWMAWGYGRIAPSRAYTAEWKAYFESAQYVVLKRQHTLYVPWDASLTTWFAKHYRLVSGDFAVYIYKKVTSG